jgi:hypothetical protein
MIDSFLKKFPIRPRNLLLYVRQTHVPRQKGPTIDGKKDKKEPDIVRRRALFI